MHEVTLHKVLFENETSTCLAGELQSTNQPIISQLHKITRTQHERNLERVEILSKINNCNVAKYIAFWWENVDTLHLLFERSSEACLENYMNTSKLNSQVFTDAGMVTILVQIMNGLAFLEGLALDFSPPLAVKIEGEIYYIVINQEQLMDFWEQWKTQTVESSWLRRYHLTSPTVGQERKKFQELMESHISFGVKLYLADECGDEFSQYSLAHAYLTGKSGAETIAVDFTKAFKYFALSANQNNNSEALLNVGVCYGNGEGVEENLQEAVEIFRVLAKQGHAAAQYNLGICFEEGIVVGVDFQAALDLYTRAAQQRHPNALQKLALFIEQGIIAQEEAKELLNLLYHLWINDITNKCEWDAQIQYMLGMCLMYGRAEFVINFCDAAQLFALSAVRGHSGAQYELAMCLEMGLGVDKSDRRAIELYTNAANQGHLDAQYNLAAHYLNGRQGNVKRAIALIENSAGLGHAKAQNTLAVFRTHGIGMNQDKANATFLFEQSAKQGNTNAQYNLGASYVRQNSPRGFELLERLEHTNDPRVHYYLFICFADGLGVEIDYDKAVQHFLQTGEEWNPYLEKLYNASYPKDPCSHPMKIFKILAELGKGKAQCMALRYTGKEVATDPQEAATSHRIASPDTSFHDAIQNGNPTEQHYLAIRLMQGNQIKKGMQKACQLLRLSAAAGYADSQYQLALLCDGSAEALDLLLQSSNQGHSDAQYYLGYCYKCGKGVEKNLTKAVEWITAAANQGHSGAQYKLVKCYMTGLGVDVDIKKADKFLRLSKVRNSKLQLELALHFYEGKGVEVDFARAARLFTLAQELPEAKYYLAVCYVEGKGVIFNMSKAIQLLCASFQAGFEKAEFMLMDYACRFGNCYKKGECGVEMNEEKAIDYFMFASDRGDIDAQFELGVCYKQRTRGLPIDESKAVKYFGLAASSGHLDAQYELALCYKRGEGVELDEEMAIDFFAMAAEEGHIKAKYQIAMYIMKEKGATADYVVEIYDQLIGANLKKKADKLLTLAAKYYRGIHQTLDHSQFYNTVLTRGDSALQYKLGKRFWHGKNVTQDLRKAVDLFTASAIKEHSGAQFYLGICFKHGWDVVEVDLNKSFEYFSRAAAHGHTSARYHTAKCYSEGVGVGKNLQKGLELMTLLAESETEDREVKLHSRENLKHSLEMEKNALELFKIERLLGVGSDGAVFLVQLGEKMYALKMIMNLHLLKKEQLDNRYGKEWMILERFERNSHIAQPVAHFTAQPTREMLEIFLPEIRSGLMRWDALLQREVPADTKFFLLEYHPTDLAHRLDSKATSGLKPIFRYCLEVLYALEQLHEQRVLHNDLKTDNILISSTDEIIINDFGESVLVPEDNNVLVEYLKLGNRAHKAPEIHNAIYNEMETVDVSKQYSWEAGFLMYEIAFGVSPFTLNGLPYPFSCCEVNMIHVPPLEFPENSNKQLGELEEFKGLLRFLLSQNPEDRVSIQNAITILEVINEKHISPFELRIQRLESLLQMHDFGRNTRNQTSSGLAIDNEKL